MNIPIIGDFIDGVAETTQEYFKGKTAQVKQKAKEKIEVTQARTRQKVTQVTEEGETVRKAIAAEAGTKRALINKNMRLMRRATLVVLLTPFVAGALIILGAYVGMAFDWLWWGDPVEQAAPSFKPLELFWDEVVGGAKQWWVTALQGVFSFLWAGGEITNVGAQAGGAVMDHLKEGRASNERQAKEHRRAEREKRNREREERGEPPLPNEPDEKPDEDPIVRPGPPGGGGR